MKKPNRKIFAILVAAFVIVLSAYIFLQQYLISNNSIIKSFCTKDTDCVSVCGSCVNITYFHSNPPAQCAISLNNTARTCFCVNSVCAVQTNATSEQTQSIWQTLSSDIFTFYILIAIIVIVVFLAVGFFVNYLMNSPTETW
jgi:hypothetical protein